MSESKQHSKAKVKATAKKADPKPAQKAPAKKPKSEAKPKAKPGKPNPKAPSKKTVSTSVSSKDASAPVADKPLKSPAPGHETKAAAKPPRSTFTEDLPLDIEEKEEMVEEEKKDLAQALESDDDGSWEATFVPTDTSERYILVVDEEGQRRSETTTIISQILPNAIVEVADDPEEALEMMQDCEFDTFVVNFLMPAYSASTFVKAVANHPDHPLLIGFAADKISDAVDPKKGLKIIPLKRLFDLDAGSAADSESAGNSDK